MKKGNHCPLINKKCIENKCAWYTQVRGMNPNTGQPVDEWQCAINFVPFLMIENSQQQRQTAAAVESFRNETIQRNDTANTLLYNLCQAPTLLEPVQVKTLPSNTDDG
jgi:hypothetical protein